MPRKRDQTKIDEQLRNLTALTEELKYESDRAAAVLGAAYLDERLRQYIAHFLIDEPKEVDELFGINRPLGAFGPRHCTHFRLS